MKFFVDLLNCLFVCMFVTLDSEIGINECKECSLILMNWHSVCVPKSRWDNRGLHDHDLRRPVLTPQPGPRLQCIRQISKTNTFFRTVIEMLTYEQEGVLCRGRCRLRYVQSARKPAGLSSISSRWKLLHAHYDSNRLPRHGAEHLVYCDCNETQQCVRAAVLFLTLFSYLFLLRVCSVQSLGKNGRSVYIRTLSSVTTGIHEKET